MKVIRGASVIVIGICMTIGLVYAQADSASYSDNRLLLQNVDVHGQQPAPPTELTVEQLVVNMLKAEEAIQDISYKTKLTAYTTNPAKELYVSSIWKKKPNLTLMRMAYAWGRNATTLIRSFPSL